MSFFLLFKQIFFTFAMCFIYFSINLFMFYHVLFYFSIQVFYFYHVFFFYFSIKWSVFWPWVVISWGAGWYIYIYIHTSNSRRNWGFAKTARNWFLLGIHMVSRFCRLFRKSLFLSRFALLGLRPREIDLPIIFSFQVNGQPPWRGGMSFYPKNNWLLVTPQKAKSTCQLFSLGRRPPCPSASALPVTLSFGLLSARSLPFTPPSCGSLCVAPDCRQSESPTESPPATAPPKTKTGPEPRGIQRDHPPWPTCPQDGRVKLSQSAHSKPPLHAIDSVIAPSAMMPAICSWQYIAEQQINCSNCNLDVVTPCCWQQLASWLPLEKFCYGWLHRRLLRRYRPQSAVNCSTLWERATGSPPSTSQVSL